MDVDDYMPRVLEEGSQPVVSTDTDSSKWAAVHDVLENTSSHRMATGNGTGSLFTLTWVLGISLGLLWVLRNGRTVFGQWQENVYRRANRRRHGIPDDDDRPFNVAYAAASVARKQREQQEEKETPDEPRREISQPDSEWQRHGETIGVRQRNSQAEASSSVYRSQPVYVQGISAHPLDGAGDEHMAHRSQHRAPRALESHHWSDPYNPHRELGPREKEPQPLAQQPFRSSSIDVNSRRHLNVGGGHALPERRKHHHIGDTDDDEDRTTKRTRVAGEEHIDGDDNAAWVAGGSRRGSLQVPKRGSKRHANPEDDGDWEMSQDKRARKGSSVNLVNGSDMDGVHDAEMVRDSSDAEPEPTRGTKREREDDSAADSAAYDSDESHRQRRTRKRRADGRENIDEPPSRGRKRDRVHEMSSGSDAEGEENRAHVIRRKRGRRYSDRELDSDIVPSNASESEDLPEMTEDPACGGRRMGEIWEVNGQSFKVGLDGRRLRHALLRRRRTKFAMPRDSAHMDAKTNVDVIVEKWLNDDEYNAAKESYELAWQEASPVSTPNKAEPSTQDEPSISGGKRLLWTGPLTSPAKGRTSIRSASNVQNPFDLAPSDTGRRVASAHLLMNNPAESPKLRSSKSFSRWEKQDLEANSLKKMRARFEKEMKEKEKEQQKEQEKDRAKAKAAMTPPAFTPLAPTTNTQAQTPLLPTAPPTLGLKHTAANPFAKPASAMPSGHAPTPGLSFPKSTSTPSTIAPGAGTQPSNASSFSFPSHATASPPATATPSNAKPSFSFEPPAPSSTALSESNKAVASKPSFSFAPNSSSTPAPFTPATPKPSFSFGPPSAQTNKSEPLKIPSFFPAPTPGSTSTALEPLKAVLSGPFGIPAPQPVPAPSTAHVTNTPFNFNTTAQPSQGAAQKPSSFQFGPSAHAQNSTGQTSGSDTSAGLLSKRLSSTPASQASQPTTPQNSWSTISGGGMTSFAPTSNGTSGTQPPASIFGRNLSESANKPTPFAPSGPPKNIFGPPTSTSSPSAFSFAQPPGASDTTKPAVSSVSFAKPSGQSDASASQSKPSFSFNFGAQGGTGASNVTPGSNPFQSFPAPSTGAPPSPGNIFGFGQSSPAPSAPNPFDFLSKPPEGEKK